MFAKMMRIWTYWCVAGSILDKRICCT